MKMKQMVLPFKLSPLKVGDRVRIKGKTAGEQGLPYRSHWKFGDIALVKRVYESRRVIFIYLTDLNYEHKPGQFRREDLEKLS